jgi:L-threonylcarbamoyladenylate synthase
MSTATVPAHHGRTEQLSGDAAGIARAIELLHDGRLVAIPTETVYGLAVRADDVAAIDRLFAAKGRPADNPLIVHVASVSALDDVAAEVTPLARALLQHFSPGPLTLVLRARDDVPRSITGGLDTVAVRVPAHPVALAVLAGLGRPLAAPSANRSSRPSPTTAAHVLADLDGAIAAVLDAGPSAVGLESTVVDARGAVPIVLRDGGISRERIASALGLATLAGSTDAMASPGTRHHHYAPSMPVHVAEPGTGAAMATALLAGTHPGTTVALVRIALDHAAPRDTAPVDAARVRLLADVADAEELATRLFSLLREAEDVGASAIVVEAVTATGVGRAVMDRLTRAAAASHDLRGSRGSGA